MARKRKDSRDLGTHFKCRVCMEVVPKPGRGVPFMCAECSDLAGRSQSAGLPASRNHPGHEERMARYAARAANGKPLFQERENDGNHRERGEGER